MSEHIIIGAGLAGAAAAWELSRRGEAVTVLERTSPANAWGSSHGSARIFRYAYPDRLFTDLVVASRSRWDELEAAGDTRLITPTGALDFGGDRHAAVIGEVLEQSGVEHELLSASAAQQRWPQFAFDTDVLWHPGAGVIDASATVDTMLRLATDTGLVQVHENWPVASIARLSGSGFLVTSADGRIAVGGSIIIAAGGWLPALLSDVALPAGFLDALPDFEIRQEQAFHMPYREADSNGWPTAAWPTFIHKSAGVFTYGLPGGRDAGFAGQKLAQFNGGKVIASALDQDGRITEEMRTRMSDYARRHLPGLVPEPYAETTCLFTNTPSEDFVLDSVDGITVVSACSGHGAKFAPLLGEFAANLATGVGDVPDRFRVACGH